MNGWKDILKDGRMNGWMSERLLVRMDELIEECFD